MSLSESAAPTREEVLAEIRSVMEAEFGMSPALIQMTTHLIDDLDLDSIDFVDLAVRLEKSTGLTLRAEELKPVRTVEDAVDVIHAGLQRRSGGRT